MGISVYNIKRWTRMLTGHSIYHVEQNLGKAFVAEQLNGYFNDMTKKVIFGDKNLDKNRIPFLVHSDGSKIEMPTMIFQYGLGAYDLWLLNSEKEYFSKALNCADWAIQNQEKSGAWNTFFYIYPHTPYSAMPQGEGVSLLLRVYKETAERKYLLAAKKAVDFMLMDVKNGGVSDYSNGELKLLEYTHLPIVMNGWIFALFGLYDFYLLTGEYKKEFLKSVHSLEKCMPVFDSGYWSMYDVDGNIASPFYHNLHIAQMQALYMVTNSELFNQYAKKFTAYQSKCLNRNRAFIKKALQKIVE